MANRILNRKGGPGSLEPFDKENFEKNQVGVSAFLNS